VRYVSTRGAGAPKRFSEILLEGLAADGGLYVPETFPKADLAAWRGLTYPELALRVLSCFIDDMPELETLVRRAYHPRVFGGEEVTPLKTLEPGLHLLCLSNGPTLAFKDIALQLLGELFESALGPTITATIHPSAVLRAADAASREREFAGLVRDLKHVAKRLTEW